MLYALRRLLIKCGELANSVAGRTVAAWRNGLLSKTPRAGIRAQIPTTRSSQRDTLGLRPQVTPLARPTCPPGVCTGMVLRRSSRCRGRGDQASRGPTLWCRVRRSPRRVRDHLVVACMHPRLLQGRYRPH